MNEVQGARSTAFRASFVAALLAALCAFVGASGEKMKAAKGAGISESLQMVMVTAADWNAVQGTAQRYERSGVKEKWRPVGAAFAVVVGRNGMGWGRGMQPASQGGKDDPIKHEGDGKSPAGIFPLTESFGYSSTPMSDAKMKYVALTPAFECVDDPKSSRYNQVLNADGMNKDWASSEQMRRNDDLYRWGVVVGQNSDPVKNGSGSCIFLHIWSGPKDGTAGCTAMEPANIEILLRWLDPAKRPMLVQLPNAEYERLSKAWALPPAVHK